MLRTLILILSFLICAPFSTAQPLFTAGDKTPKAPDPDWAPSRVVFDCTGRDTLSLTPGFVATIVDDTSDGPRDFDSYPCSGWTEDGPEHVYRLEVVEDLVLWAGLTELEGDLDLYLLNDCDTDSCLAGENVEMSAFLEPGTYFLIVDTWGSGEPSGLPYVLDLETRWPGIPPQICDPGGSTNVVCDDQLFSGDLYGKPDLVRSYDCGPTPVRGGEDWYEITSPALRVISLEVRATVEGLDPALWLFDGCGPDANCLTFVDATLAYVFDDTGTGVEFLEWPQESELPATVWLAVDCLSPPAEAGEGAYEVQINCQTVPVESTTFGGLRALFR